MSLAYRMETFTIVWKPSCRACPNKRATMWLLLPEYEYLIECTRCGAVWQEGQPRIES